MVDLRSRTALVVVFLVVAGALGALGSPAALAAPGPTVFLRIEGENATLLPRTQVTTSTDPVPSNNCSGTSVAGAIEVATHGDWDRQNNFTQTLMGETHKFDDNDYWAEWLNDKLGNGICSDELAPGDDVVMLVDRAYSPDYTPTAFPLKIVESPASVERGAAFTVKVVEIRGTVSGTGSPTPVAGATVAGGGASAQTDADGGATLSLASTGLATLQATRPGNVRSALVPVCAHAGDDGVCGPVGSGGVTTSTLDTRLPVPRIDGIPAGKRFTLRRAPRLLHGTIEPGGAGVHAVRIRLRRRVGPHCTYYSAKVERFRPGRCSATWFHYTIGDRPQWSYLLPERLRAGAYVLDLTVMDRWGRVVATKARFTVVGATR